MNFRHFDTSVSGNEFWILPIENINRNLERNLAKDKEEKEGVSFVIGCPFDSEMLSKIAKLREVFEQELASRNAPINIVWREQPNAFHFTVYGLILPKDFKTVTWPLDAKYIEGLKNILHKHRGFELSLKGLGILGMGAISVRVSDSTSLERMRDDIIALPGTSAENFGSRTKKIVIGRIKPALNEDTRSSLRESLNSIKDFEIGILKAQTLKIVHYGNTFLERVIDEIELS